MACHLFGTKPLPKAMLATLNPLERTTVKFESEIQIFILCYT